MLPRHNRTTAGQAVALIERTVRLHVAAASKELESAAPAWADGEGWYMVEEGRIVKSYYADIDSVYRTVADGGDAAGEEQRRQGQHGERQNTFHGGSDLHRRAVRLQVCAAAA